MSTTATKTTQKSRGKQPMEPWVQIPGGPELMQWRRELGITRPLFAKMADFSERKLATYEKSPKIPESGLRRIRETVKLIQALQELAGEGRALKEWLQKPNKAFHKRSPIDLIITGESDIIWEMVHQLRQRAFA